jgi:heptosyltransferase I
LLHLPSETPSTSRWSETLTVSSGELRKIFVLTHEGIGDLVFLLPALRALKSNLPELRILMPVSSIQRHLAGTLQGSLVETFPLYDCGFSHLFREVRRFRPDVFFEFDGGLRYAVLAMCSGARRRIHPPAELVKPYASALHREALALNAGGHRVETLLTLVDRLGLKRTDISFDFPVPDQYRKDAESLIERYIPSGSVALIPSSGTRWKDWPAESLQQTVDILARDLKRSVVLIGREKRYPDLRHVIDLSGRSNFLTDAYLLRYSGAFAVAAGVDTGMMQIAGSINSNPAGNYAGVSGNRTVSLFGPTEASIYRPYDPTKEFNLVVKPGMKSTAMGAVGWAGDRFERHYMKEIDTLEIVESVERHFAAIRASDSPTRV